MNATTTERLNAAAPAMFSLLDKIVETSTDDNGKSVRIRWELVDRASALIAQVRGESEAA